MVHWADVGLHGVRIGVGCRGVAHRAESCNLFVGSLMR